MTPAKLLNPRDLLIWHIMQGIGVVTNDMREIGNGIGLIVDIKFWLPTENEVSFDEFVKFAEFYLEHQFGKNVVYIERELLKDDNPRQGGTFWQLKASFIYPNDNSVWKRGQ